MNDATDLQRIPLFSELGEEVLRQMHPLMHRQQFAPGQTILIEGEAGDALYMILAGQVKFLTYTANKEELVLGMASAGEYFGELSMLTGAPRAARVVAEEPTTALALKFSDFEALLLRHPSAAIGVMRTLATRLHQSDELLRQIGAKNPNNVDDARRTLGNRISDYVARVMGSWRFIFSMAALITFWVTYNVLASAHNAANPEDLWRVIDDFPFILLNLSMSLIAVFSAPIIMMSQNRAAEKDRLVAEIDHDVNVKSELQIGQIIRRLDDLEKSIHH